MTWLHGTEPLKIEKIDVSLEKFLEFFWVAGSEFFNLLWNCRIRRKKKYGWRTHSKSRHGQREGSATVKSAAASKETEFRSRKWFEIVEMEDRPPPL